MDKGNDRLAKNRQSAKNSRKRKKIYLEVLENTVKQLQKDLEKALKTIE